MSLNETNFNRNLKFKSQKELERILFGLKMNHHKLLEINRRNINHIKTLNLEIFNRQKLHESTGAPITNANQSARNISEYIITIDDDPNNTTLNNDNERIIYLKNKKNNFQKMLEEQIIKQKHINHMIESEKKNNQFTIQALIKITNNFDFVRKNNQANFQNFTIFKQKENKFSEMKHSLEQEKNKLSCIINGQINLVETINNLVHLSQETNSEMIKTIESSNLKKSNENTEKKTNYQKQFQETNIYKNTVSEKEYLYTKIILGFDLIKKNFLDQNKDVKSLEQLFESNDFLTFKSKSFNFSDPPYSTSVTESNSKNKRFTSFRTTNSASPTSSNTVCLNTLREKLDFISNIEYEELKILVDQLTYKKNLSNNFLRVNNTKQITLESKKEELVARLNRIVQNDKKNFHDFIKNNSKAENVIRKQGFSYKIQSGAPKITLSIPQIEFKNKWQSLIEEIKVFFQSCIFLYKNFVLNEKIKSQFYSLEIKVNKFFKSHEIKENMNLSNYVDQIFFESSKIISQKDKEILDDLRNFMKNEGNTMFLISGVPFEYSTFQSQSNLNSVFEIFDQILKILSDFDGKNVKGLNYTNFLKNLYKKGREVGLSAIKEGSPAQNLKKELKFPRNYDFQNDENTLDESEEALNRIFFNDCEKKNSRNTLKKPSLISSLTTRLTKDSQGFIQEFHRKILQINETTKNAKKEIYELNKQKEDSEKHRTVKIIYNHPEFKVENLSKNTYNNLVSHLFLRKSRSKRNPNQIQVELKKRKLSRAKSYIKISVMDLFKSTRNSEKTLTLYPMN